MARGSTTVLLLLVALLGAGSLHAAETSATDSVQPLGWLKAGDFAALDDYYSRRQQDYEAGRISDEQLYASFRRLYEDAPGNEAYYDRWAAAYPNSYAAVLARGIYRYRMAWAVRGEQYIADTPAQHIVQMKSWLARGRSDLVSSLKLAKKPYLSALYLLNAAMLDGSEEERHWYEQGMAIDPANVLVRYRYMFSLRPRWGGSYRQMEDFLAQQRAQQVSPALLARLAMLIHADKAEDAMRGGDNQRTFDEWQEVLRLAQVAGEPPGTEALIGYTRAAQDLNRPADAARGLGQLRDRDPQDAWSQARLGWIYYRAHEDEKAWPLLLKAAEHSDSWAQWVVGRATYYGVPELHKAPDQQAGLVWIRRSAGQCFQDATTFLAARGEKPAADCKRRRPGAEREWWEPLLPAAGVLLTTLVTALAAVLRKRAQPAAPPARMQYPSSLRAFAAFVLSGLIMLAAAFAVTAGSGGAGGPFMAPVLAMLGAVGILLIVLIIASARIWHVLTPDGMEFGRLLGRRGLLKWRDVIRLAYSRVMRSFRIETASGEVVFISSMLTGMPEFARAVLEQVPGYALEDGVREALQARTIKAPAALLR